MVKLFAVLCAVPLVLGQKQPLPAKGDNGDMGGIFGMGVTALPKGALPGTGKNGGGEGLTDPGTESPKPGPRNTNGGSGPYKAQYVADKTIPNHTVYAPITPPPANVKLPVIVWGNGACVNAGTVFNDFLTEIASYGYLIVANGDPKPIPKGVSESPVAGLLGVMGSGTSKVQQLTDAVDWVVKGGGKNYGNIDTTKIAAAGQSCGGLEAYSASYHDDRIKLTALFNSGLRDPNKLYLLQELKAPVAFFLGGPKDAAYVNGERDYDNLPKGLPSVKASLDSGHLGTYASTSGGKFGKAAVAFFEWQFKGDEKFKLKFTDPKSEGSLVKDNWNVTMKGY